MKIFFIVGMLLSSAEMYAEKDILIQHDGNNISIVKPSDIILPLPGGPFINFEKI